MEHWKDEMDKIVAPSCYALSIEGSVELTGLSLSERKEHSLPKHSTPRASFQYHSPTERLSKEDLIAKLYKRFHI